MLNNKKNILEKQKDLKSKYTIVKKNDNSKLENHINKSESIKKINV